MPGNGYLQDQCYYLSPHVPPLWKKPSVQENIKFCLTILVTGPKSLHNECHFSMFLVINPCIIMLRGDKPLCREGKVKHRVETFFPPFSIQILLKPLSFQQSCSVTVCTLWGGAAGEGKPLSVEMCLFPSGCSWWERLSLAAGCSSIPSAPSPSSQSLLLEGSEAEGVWASSSTQHFNSSSNFFWEQLGVPVNSSTNLGHQGLNAPSILA